MQTGTASPTDGAWPGRVILIDDHEISRAVCRALLRAEGVDVIADLGASEQALTTARALCPDVAIVDVTPGADTGFAIADRLRALPVPPIVILTSSTDRAQFDAQLNDHLFMAKADISAAAVARLARAPETGGPEPPNPDAPAERPQPRQ